MLVGVQVVLGQVIVLINITRDDEGLSLVHALDGLLVAGDEVQHQIVVHEIGRADLVALRQSQNGRSEEVTIVLWN